MKDLTPEIKQQLLAPFDIAEIRIRTQPYTAPYVTARVVMTRLDEILPFQWGFVLGEDSTDDNKVLTQKAFIQVRHSDGVILEYHDKGNAPPDVGRGQAKQTKHAVSDALKRCAVHLGVARYLYELPNVKPNSVPKEMLEKALAAVGYRGPWGEAHYGTIGGIRSGDYEDDYEGESTPPVQTSAQTSTQKKAAAPPKSAPPKAAEPTPDPKTSPEMNDRARWAPIKPETGHALVALFEEQHRDDARSWFRGYLKKASVEEFKEPEAQFMIAMGRRFKKAQDGSIWWQEHFEGGRPFELDGSCMTTATALLNSEIEGMSASTGELGPW